jgi:hypothetical protein
MAPELQVTLKALECPAFASGVGLAERMPGLSEQIGLSLGGAVRSLGGCTNPFRYFNSSPEVIRLTVMMYVRVAQLPGLALDPRFCILRSRSRIGTCELSTRFFLRLPRTCSLDRPSSRTAAE